MSRDDDPLAWQREERRDARNSAPEWPHPDTCTCPAHYQEGDV